MDNKNWIVLSKWEKFVRKNLKITILLTTENLTFEQKVYAFAKEFRPSDKEIEEFKQFLNNDTQKEFIFKGRGVALIIKDKNDSLSVLRGNAYIDPLLL